jgi:hypothetical protein
VLSVSKQIRGGHRWPWTGTDPFQHLNTIESTDGGQSWGNKVRYGDTAYAGVDLDLFRLRLFTTWTGTSLGHHANVATVG